MAFAGSATEALPAAVIPDLFFLHERGLWMGLYSLFLTVGGAIGAIISGFMITNVGYRWVFWVMP
jgi:MFS family permease